MIQQNMNTNSQNPVKRRGPVKGQANMIDVPLSELIGFFSLDAKIKVSRKWLIQNGYKINGSTAQSVVSSPVVTAAPVVVPQAPIEVPTIRLEVKEICEEDFE